LISASGLDRRRSHVVISAPSQWGQQGCFHLLHRAVAHGGRVTIIIPRRHEKLFRTAPPKFEGWKSFSSLKECFESLRAAGKPVDFIFDDHLNQLAAELISERQSGSHLTVGYVTSGAEDHFTHAKYLSSFCERVLVEKPVSRIYSEIEPEGCFPRLAREAQERNCVLKTAEHYLFRPGVTQVWSIGPSDSVPSTHSLNSFLNRHQRCNLHYEFHFAEAAGRDDPAQRPGAYQDGSILDILAPHGMGPVARLLLPTLGIVESKVDYYRDVVCKSIQTWRATDPLGESLKVPVLAETAAEFVGLLELRGRNQTIKLTLRSAKGCRGFLRFFKFFCPIHTCRLLDTEDREELIRDLGVSADLKDQSLFCGVSLGAAGSTILDYLPGVGKVFWERDGGYRSDSRGGNTEAANAQAAMVDALLLAREFEDANGRFVPVESACQLVRLGLKLQGIASCDRGSSYVWGGDEPVWTAEPAPPSAAGNAPDLGGEVRVGTGAGVRLLEIEPGVEQVAAVLGASPRGLVDLPYHRVVTVLGPEGAGNSDVALTLHRKFAKEWLCPVAFLDVPRDEDWDRPQAASPEAAAVQPSRFTLDMVLRQLAWNLGLPLTTTQRPAEALPHYLRRVKGRLPGNGIILLNGVDRLPDEGWRVLVRILNELPTRYRILIVTKMCDRAAGFVVRTENLLGSPEFQHLSESRLDYFFHLFTHRLSHTPSFGGRQHYDLLRTRLHRFAWGNLTLEQQISSYVMYIALPAALRKMGAAARQEWWHINLEGVDWRELVRFLNQEVESLDIPRPLVPYPEALLDRVSKMCLAMIGEAERAAIRSLAVVSGYLHSEIVDEALPGMFHRVRHFQPVRALFERVEKHRALLFPRVRRAALTCDDKELAEIRFDVERRRLILALRGLRQVRSEDPIQIQQLQKLHESQIRLFYGTTLGHLNLDGGSFEECCCELIEPLETSSDLQGDQAAGSLIELLTESSELRQTNLGLNTRARLARLKGWLLRSSAGTDPARLHEAMSIAWSSYYVADFCARQAGGAPRAAGRRERTALVLTIQGVVFGGLVHSRCWHRLFGLKAPPWPADQQWEKFVEPGTGSEGDRSLWSLCAITLEADFLPSLPDLSEKVRALGLRALALYLVSHPETGANPEWRRRAAKLCLWAAHLNKGKAKDCQARNLLEAALFLGDQEVVPPPGTRGRPHSATTLRQEARRVFKKVRKGHPGLAPYMDLLDLVLASRLGSGSMTANNLAQLESEFELTGEVYFAQLTREMRSQVIRAV
jgi:hypothetical protein